MANTVQDAVKAIQDAVLTVHGIKKAPDTPPDKVTAADFPIVIAYPDSGNWDGGPAGWKKGLHNIGVELHVPLTTISKTWSTLVPYIDSIPNAIYADVTLNGTVDTVGEITYETGPMDYSGVDTLGVLFIINNVKMQSAAS